MAGAAIVALLWSAASGEATPHGPIVVEGDEAFCEGDSGVVNCGDADGSPSSPYRISGWEIVAAPGGETACGDVHAGIHLCGTEAHVVIEDVQIDVPTGAPANAEAVEHASAVHIVGGGNVTLRDVDMRTSGRALAIEDLPERHAARPMPPVRVEGGTMVSTIPALSGLVVSMNGNLTMERTLVQANDRPFAVHSRFLDDASGRHPPWLRLIDVDIEGPRLSAVEAEGGHLLVERSDLEVRGVPAPAAGPLGGLQISVLSILNGATAEVRDSTLRFTGTGIEANDAASVLVRANRFEASDGDLAFELHRPEDSRVCDVVLDYNDLGALGVLNHADDCPVRAPGNWWGGSPPDQDQLQGLVEVPSWSPVPLADMPRTTLEATPEAASSILVLQGQATGPVDRLRLEGDLTAETAATPGPFQWELALKDAPLGPLDLRLHACSESFCGPPVAWSLRHTKQPLPPVPVLTADAVVAAGATVAFDASGSFSPQGTPIEAYRFADGPWIHSPVHNASWSEAGTHTMTLVVRDAEGLESTRTATATIHVRSPALAHAQDAPFLLPLPVLAYLVLRRRA